MPEPLLLAQDRTARLWDERVSDAVAVFSVPQPAHSAAAAAAGDARSVLAVGDECGQLTFFDLRRPAEPLFAANPHSDVVQVIALKVRTFSRLI